MCQKTTPDIIVIVIFETEQIVLVVVIVFFNPVFHNVTLVAHGLKLVMTRKINLKNFEILF